MLGLLCDKSVNIFVLILRLFHIVIISDIKIYKLHQLLFVCFYHKHTVLKMVNEFQRNKCFELHHSETAKVGIW